MTVRTVIKLRFLLLRAVMRGAKSINKKKTNPTAEKILIICKVLDVTPEWLLSGVEMHGTRSNPAPIIAVDVRTEAGQLLETYNSCDAAMQARILGYAQAIGKMGEEQKKRK